MDSFKERLSFLMHHFGLNQQELSELTGVSRSSVGHVLNGRNQPSMDFLAGILTQWPEIDADWLVMGKGPWQRSQFDSKTPDKEAIETVNIKHFSNKEMLETEDGNQAQGNLFHHPPSWQSAASDPGPLETELESMETPKEIPKAAEPVAPQKEEGLLWVLFPDGSYRSYRPKE